MKTDLTPTPAVPPSLALTPSAIRQFMASLPRPIQVFIGMALVCVLIKSVRATTGGSARAVADAVGEGLQSVLREQKNHNMMLLSTVDMANNAGTVEIKDFGVGLLGTLLSGGVKRAGGSAYFHQYDNYGVAIDGGPLDLQLPDGKVTIRGEERGKMLVQGTLFVDGQATPVPVQLVFWITNDAVGLVMGSVWMNGRKQYLKGDDYDLFYQ